MGGQVEVGGGDFSATDFKVEFVDVTGSRCRGSLTRAWTAAFEGMYPLRPGPAVAQKSLSHPRRQGPAPGATWSGRYCSWREGWRRPRRRTGGVSSRQGSRTSGGLASGDEGLASYELDSRQCLEVPHARQRRGSTRTRLADLLGRDRGLRRPGAQLLLPRSAGSRRRRLEGVMASVPAGHSTAAHLLLDGLRVMPGLGPPA